jgi:hypothetical protein
MSERLCCPMMGAGNVVCLREKCAWWIRSGEGCAMKRLVFWLAQIQELLDDTRCGQE